MVGQSWSTWHDDNVTQVPTIKSVANLDSFVQTELVFRSASQPHNHKHEPVEALALA